MSTQEWSALIPFDISRFGKDMKMGDEGPKSRASNYLTFLNFFI